MGSTFLSEGLSKYRSPKILFIENHVLGLVTVLSPACYSQTIIDIHCPSDRSARTAMKLRSLLSTQQNYDCIKAGRLWLQIKD